MTDMTHTPPYVSGQIHDLIGPFVCFDSMGKYLASQPCERRGVGLIRNLGAWPFLF